MIAEEYKIINDFPKYEVSNFGNVRNCKTGRVLSTCDDSNGYRIVSLRNDTDRAHKKVHRLVANAFLLNPENKPCVDHINGNRQDNNVLNLRYATYRENGMNLSISKRNKSGCKGVSFHKSISKWQSQIVIDGINIHLGYFNSIEEAKIARINRANQVFGAFTNACERL